MTTRTKPSNATATRWAKAADTVSAMTPKENPTPYELAAQDGMAKLAELGLTPMGVKEVAEYLGREVNTVERWAFEVRQGRGPKDPLKRFPDPAGHISGRWPFWFPTQIDAWGLHTGRLVEE